MTRKVLLEGTNADTLLDVLELEDIPAGINVWPYQIGSPSDFVTSLEYIENSSSSGITSGCSLTNNGDGTIDVAEGVAILRATSDRLSDLYTIQVNEQTGLALTDMSVNYVYLDYNAGAPEFKVSTTKTAFNGIDKVLALIVYRSGTDLKFLNLEGLNVDTDERLIQYLLDTRRFVRVGNGSLLGSSGLNITLSSGAFYFMLTEVPHPDFDTGAADTFEYSYRDGGGDWTFVPGQTDIDTANYDNGSGTLQSHNMNDYGVEWVYLLVDNDPELVVLYGQENYEKLVDAQAATPPNELPGKVSELGELVGRVIYKTNASTLTPESAFTTTFGFTTPITHNGLTQIQGGQLNERYHLTADQHEQLTGGTTAVSAASYTVLITDSVVMVDDDAAGGNVTVNLLAAATAGDGYSVVIFKKGSTGIVTIDGDGAETINGDATFDLSVQYESIKVISDGSEWFIIEA